MMKKILLLVDDLSTPFWAEWPTWPEQYQVISKSGFGSVDPWDSVQNALNEAAKHSGGAELYVISDSEFGVFSSGGGGRLISRLAREIPRAIEFVRGVVYSDLPQLPAMSDPARILGLRKTPFASVDRSHIFDFLESGRMPETNRFQWLRPCLIPVEILCAALMRDGDLNPFQASPAPSSGDGHLYSLSTLKYFEEESLEQAEHHIRLTGKEKVANEWRRTIENFHPLLSLNAAGGERRAVRTIWEAVATGGRIDRWSLPNDVTVPQFKLSDADTNFHTTIAPRIRELIADADVRKHYARCALAEIAGLDVALRRLREGAKLAESSSR